VREITHLRFGLLEYGNAVAHGQAVLAPQRDEKRRGFDRDDLTAASVPRGCGGCCGDRNCARRECARGQIEAGGRTEHHFVQLDEDLAIALEETDDGARGASGGVTTAPKADRPPPYG